MNDREILFRLIRDGKIVGWEKHAITGNLMEIFHCKINTATWWNIQTSLPSNKSYIKHDSKDAYIGQKDVNGDRIFENDKVGYEDLAGLVVFRDGGFVIDKIGNLTSDDKFYANQDFQEGVLYRWDELKRIGNAWT